MQFQSTRPSRGETTSVYHDFHTFPISIHSPLAGRDPVLPFRLPHHLSISIHSPLAGRDQIPPFPFFSVEGFQSTRPSRGETRPVTLSVFLPLNFNPLAPRGARRPGMWLPSHFKRFQSTRPSRGETADGALSWQGCNISIHSPLAGRDHMEDAASPHEVNFNPLAPRGARRRPIQSRHSLRLFQSTRPSRGETYHVARSAPLFLRFQSTRPSRGETYVLTSPTA